MNNSLTPPPDATGSGYTAPGAWDKPYTVV